jgi:DNA-binding transcriptional LysR family regulator
MAYVHKSTRLQWDDLRFVLALIDAGSLARAAKSLQVDHTTVGRRVEAAEAALGVRLFTRTRAGYVPTPEAKRLSAPMRTVEGAVDSLERVVHAGRGGLEGSVRVTSPETLGVAFLAPALAAFGRKHPDLVIELEPAGTVLDLGRQEAEIAVRCFKSKGENLVVRRVASIGYGLYASHNYLAQRPTFGLETIADFSFLGPPGAKELETVWLKRLCPKAHVGFVSTLSIALREAARADAGIAILPRYLGDAEPSLRYLPMPNEPTESVWLTVHKDLRSSPRVRAVLDFLVEALGRLRA